MMNVDEIEADCAAKAALSIGAVDVALDILRRAGLLCELCCRAMACGWLAIQPTVPIYAKDHPESTQRSTSIARACGECVYATTINAQFVVALSTTINMPTLYRVVSPSVVCVAAKTTSAIWLIA